MEADHNTMGMDDETFDLHVAQMAKADIALAEARTRRKNARKAFQASGGVLGDLDAMVRLRDLGHEEAMQTFRRQAAYGRRLGVLPRGVQLDLFGDVVMDPAVDRARDAGKWAGLTGKPMAECPHEPSVPQHQAWIEGWHRGAAIFAKDVEDQTLADINARDAATDPMEPTEMDDDGPEVPEEDADEVDPDDFLGEIDADAERALAS